METSPISTCRNGACPCLAPQKSRMISYVHRIPKIQYQEGPLRPWDGTEGSWLYCQHFGITLGYALCDHLLHGSPGGSIVARFQVTPMEACWGNM